MATQFPTDPNLGKKQEQANRLNQERLNQDAAAKQYAERTQADADLNTHNPGGKNHGKPVDQKLAQRALNAGLGDRLSKYGWEVQNQQGNEYRYGQSTGRNLASPSGASASVQLNPLKSNNVYSAYEQRKTEYGALSQRFEAGGRADVAIYNQLVETQKQLNVLGPAVMGANISREMFKSLSPPALSQPAGLVSREGSSFAPYGGSRQIEIERSKVAIDKRTGELGIYQERGGLAGKLNPGKFVLVSGGGRNAAQSGTFSIDRSLTPAVIKQWSGKTPGFVEGVDLSLASEISANRTAFSRLGSEPYGGFVVRSDGRTVQSTGSRYSVYADPKNLANFVDRAGVNLSKAQAPGAKIPWEVSASTPRLSYMNERGLIGDTITKTKTVGGSAVQTAPSTQNIFDVYNARTKEYETLSKQYEAGGKRDQDAYTRLTKMASEIRVLSMGKFGADVVNKDMQRVALANLPRPYVSKPGAGEIKFNPLTALASLTPQPFGNIFGVATIPTSGSGVAAFRTAGESLMRGDTLKAYDEINRAIAPATTDPFGQGRALIASPDFTEPIGITTRSGQLIGITPFTANVAKGIISDVSQKPIDVITYFGIGSAFRAGEAALSYGIAKTATSKLPIISTAGRALSTPLAGDVGSAVKVVMGGAFAYTAVTDISAQPTAERIGEKVASYSKQAGLFALGYSALKPPTFENPYAGRGFFSGEYQFSPVERARMKTSAFFMSQSVPAENRAAYRSVVDYFVENRFKQPVPGGTEKNPLGTGFREPDISTAATIGPERAAAIRNALGEVPHVVKGSVVMGSQKTGLSTSKLFRPSHDLDVEVANVKDFDAALAKYGETSKGLDVKQFETNYPQISGVTGATAEDTGAIKYSGYAAWVKTFLGEPIREVQGIKLPRSSEILVAGKDYPGKINQELFNVQFARKSQALMQDMLPASAKAGNPEARAMNEMFRLPKDYYDYQLVGRDLTGAAQLKAGKPIDVGIGNKYLQTVEKTKFNLKFTPLEDNPVIGAKAGVPFERAMTGKEIRLAYEESILGGKKVTGYPLRNVDTAPGLIEIGSSSLAKGSGLSLSPIVSNSKSRNYGFKSPSGYGLPSITSVVSQIKSPSISPGSGIPSPSIPKSPSLKPSKMWYPISPKPITRMPSTGIPSIVPSVSPKISYAPSPSIVPSPSISIPPYLSPSASLTPSVSPPSFYPGYYPPPYSPRFTSITTSIPPVSGFFSSTGGVGSVRGRKRKFVELFPMGLDIGFKNLIPKVKISSLFRAKPARKLKKVKRRRR